MNLKQSVNEVINGHSEEFISVKDVMAHLPSDTNKHNVQNYMAKFYKEGILSKGICVKGKGTGRQYKILKFLKKEDEEPDKGTVSSEVTFEELGEAMYTQLVTLRRKLRETTEKLRDVEYKAKETRSDYYKTVQKLNKTIQEKNSVIERLRSRPESKDKSFKLEDVVRVR